MITSLRLGWYNGRITLTGGDAMTSGGMRGGVIVLGLILSAGATAAPATLPASTRPAASPTTRLTKEAAEHAIVRAYEMIGLDQFEDARKMLEPVMRVDPNGGRANLGMGYTLLRLGRTKEAIPALEKAYSAQPTDRTLVLTLAAALQEENPMRAARVLKEHMSASPGKAPDEELQNALFSVLNRAANDPKVNKEGFFEECKNFYMTYDQRLSEAHDHGEKHWGNTWIVAKDADKKWDVVITRQKAYAEASRNAELSTRNTAKAKDQLQFVNNGFGLHSERERRAAADDYKAATATEKKAYAAKERAEAALNKAEQPPFLKSIPVPPFWQKE
jgi:tetratricopeptide (TPR) repeat protein